MPAGLTGAAADHRLDGDSIARREAVDVRSDRDDLSGELMALGRAGVRDVVELATGPVLVQVAAADPGSANPDDRFPGPGTGSATSSTRISCGP